MKVLFGICAGFDNLPQLAEAGFDYVELTTYDLVKASKESFFEMRKIASRSSVLCEASNLFYPTDFRVTGDNIDEDKIYNYIEKAVARAGMLNIRNITIGSGPARTVPEGFSRETAFFQFGDQIKYAGQLAGKQGISITIEPIQPSNTNLIINLAEGVALAEYVNLPNVKTMADINQMTGAGDTIDMIYRYGAFIGHLHILDMKNRKFPVDPEDAESTALVKAYLSVNPGGRITVEGAPFTTVENARLCLKALKNYIERAKI